MLFFLGGLISKTKHNQRQKGVISMSLQWGDHYFHNCNDFTELSKIRLTDKPIFLT